MLSFFQAVAFVVGMFAAANNPLPEDPATTDDTWDCYTVADENGTVLERVCESEVTPCHYKHRPTECKRVLRWKVPK